MRALPGTRADIGKPTLEKARLSVYTVKRRKYTSIMLP